MHRCIVLCTGANNDSDPLVQVNHLFHALYAASGDTMEQEVEDDFAIIFQVSSLVKALQATLFHRSALCGPGWGRKVTTLCCDTRDRRKRSPSPPCTTMTIK